ncbi:MAG: hypothetical protein ACRYG8_03415 [Janthinobacterium lividum]
MPINSLPAAIQSMIQAGFLDRNIYEALQARLGFRLIAERESFGAEIGETVTKTRTGLLPAVTTPSAPAALTDLSSGMAAQGYGAEQFLLRVDQYNGTMPLNVVTSRVAIGNQFLLNARKLAEQAARSVDTIARNRLFDAYLGGNTTVTATIGAAGTTVHVDDIRGFFSLVGSNGQVVPVSSTNPLAVAVGGDTYELVSAIADGPAPAFGGPQFLVYSGQGGNTSTAFGGVSGTLVFSGNVSVADGTEGEAVIASNAPAIFRPAGATSTGALTKGSVLTIDAILQAKATLEANNVPTMDNGLYACFADPLHLTGLYRDPAFQSFTRGRLDSEEYRQGAIAELLGVMVLKTNQNPTQVTANGIVRRAIVCGMGALVEGTFTGTGYAAAEAVGDDELISVVDGIAHVTREPIDALKQVVTQSWSYIGGFTAPTDALTTPATVATATNSAWKRAAIVESF